jgi:hypothetical protein
VVVLVPTIILMESNTVWPTHHALHTTTHLPQL